jgi:hypothetical protein
MTGVDRWVSCFRAVCPDVTDTAPVDVRVWWGLPGVTTVDAIHSLEVARPSTRAFVVARIVARCVATRAENRIVESADMADQYRIIANSYAKSAIEKADCGLISEAATSAVGAASAAAISDAVISGEIEQDTWGSFYYNPYIINSVLYADSASVSTHNNITHGDLPERITYIAASKERAAQMDDLLIASEIEL